MEGVVECVAENESYQCIMDHEQFKVVCLKQDILYTALAMINTKRSDPVSLPLPNIKKLNGFHLTGSLKVLHSLLLKYCPKWQHCSYDGMQACVELVILDHNYNTQRP